MVCGFTERHRRLQQPGKQQALQFLNRALFPLACLEESVNTKEPEPPRKFEKRHLLWAFAFLKQTGFMSQICICSKKIEASSSVSLGRPAASLGRSFLRLRGWQSFRWREAGLSGTLQYPQWPPEDVLRIALPSRSVPQSKQSSSEVGKISRPTLNSPKE